jgi:hypothetical protein
LYKDLYRNIKKKIEKRLAIYEYPAIKKAAKMKVLRANAKLAEL